MSLATNVANLATRISTECKSLRTLINGNQANLNALNTTAKNNLVAAINELQAMAGTQINDAATNGTQAWSSQKIVNELQAIKTQLMGPGVPAALDTLDEIAAALGDDANFAATMTAALGNRVRVDAVQAFTSGQKTQGRANLDAAGTAEVGDTTTDFVATFNAGLL